MEELARKQYASTAAHAGFDLARRLEQTEITVSETSLNRWVERHPELGATSAALAGGKALFFGTASPLSQALGVGMNGPVTADDFDRLESFFIARGAPVVISLCPLADPTVLALVHERRYRITHFENTLIRPVAPNETFDVPAWVQSTAPADRELWCRTVMMGFSEGEPVNDDTVRTFSAFFGADSSRAWSAFNPQGVVQAGAGASYLSGTAMLYGDSTLPSFRGQGAQSALIAARLRMAVETGCNLAMACTLPGSVSQRNYERAGFHVVYTKPMLARDSF